MGLKLSDRHNFGAYSASSSGGRTTLEDWHTKFFPLVIIEHTLDLAARAPWLAGSRKAADRR